MPVEQARGERVKRGTSRWPYGCSREKPAGRGHREPLVTPVVCWGRSQMEGPGRGGGESVVNVMGVLWTRRGGRRAGVCFSLGLSRVFQAGRQAGGASPAGEGGEVWSRERGQGHRGASHLGQEGRWRSSGKPQKVVFMTPSFLYPCCDHHFSSGSPPKHRGPTCPCCWRSRELVEEGWSSGPR